MPVNDSDPAATKSGAEPLGAEPDEPESMEEEIEEALEDIADGRIPDKVRWRPVFLWKGLAFGIVADLAIEVLFQQFGIAPLEPMSIVRGVALGTLIGIAAPSAGAGFGAFMVNREIRRLEMELGLEAA